MNDRVVPVEDLLREFHRPLKALLWPAVARVGYVLHEQRERLLVAAAGRHLYELPAVRGPEVDEERLGVRRRPLPGVSVGELRQARRTRVTRGLIVPSCFRNRVCCCRAQPASMASNKCWLRVHVDDPIHQFQTCRTGRFAA
jgi:hypothetical protein